MLNLHRDKNRSREPGRDEKILSDHRQDGNVAVVGIGPNSTLRPIGREKQANNLQPGGRELSLLRVLYCTVL